MEFLPVLEWARSISGWYKWNKPPLRACFIFDDPNLHSTNYGFLSFERLIAEGRRHGFHTALATVPLDQYYVNRAAADLLRENRDVISLLVHGNNHTYRELASDRPTEITLAMIEQALARIERLEHKAGLAAACVMAPPHGACAVDTLKVLAQAGFEAACMSHGSLHAASGTSQWGRGIGADSTMLIQGLPVIPRFGFRRGTNSEVLIPAYLDQPLIATGHHWDLEDGVGPLIETARSINALGDVAWSDLSTIARGNYRWRIEAEHLRVRSFSRSFRVQVGSPGTELEFAL